MLGLTTGLMLYKPELLFGQISLLVPLVSTNSSIMASDQGKVDFTVYGKELLQMSQQRYLCSPAPVQDGHGCDEIFYEMSLRTGTLSVYPEPASCLCGSLSREGTDF